jgi:hypothetical protein
MGRGWLWPWCLACSKHGVARSVMAGSLVALLAAAAVAAASACSIGPSEVPPWAHGQGVSTPPASSAPPTSRSSPTPAPSAADAGADTPDAAPVTSPPAADASADDVAVDPTDAAPTPAEAGKSSAPTWTDIFNDYLALGTVGSCGTCHGQADTASDTFAYLQTSYAPTSFASAFTWSGGNMPLNGPSSNAQASADVAAWVAAGAQNN